MPGLTVDLLNRFPFKQYADAQTIQRGKAYFKEGRVWDVDVKSETHAVCSVQGDSGEYVVDIRVNRKTNELEFECDCPYGEDHFCKHMVAAALELSDYLESGDEWDEDCELVYENITGEDVDETRRNDPLHLFSRIFDDLKQEPNASRQVIDVNPISKGAPRWTPPPVPWKNKLEGVFQQMPRSRTGGNYQKYAAVIVLEKKEYAYYSSYSYSFIPYIIKANEWSPLGAFTPADAQAVNRLLETDRDWIRFAEDMRNKPNAAGCLNLTPQGLNLLSIFHQFGRFYGSMFDISTFLPLVAQAQIPLYLYDEEKRVVHHRIEVFPEPVEVEITFVRDSGSLYLYAGLKNQPFSPGAHEVEVISPPPNAWMLADNKLFTLADAKQASLLSSFPIAIPEAEADYFREHYLRKVAEMLPIKSDLIQWRDIQEEAVPRLYLHDDQGSRLLADLRFGYGDCEVEASKTRETSFVETVPGTWELLRIHRQPEREVYFYQLLTDSAYRLKRAGNDQPYGTFELRTRSHPFDFLLYSVPLLTKAGFEIYGEEKLKLGKINRSTPTLRVSITSGIDWFDLKTIVAYGDMEISLQEVRKAMKRGDQFIKLADGSIGQIPAEWLEKYKHLWNLANETEDGFRVSDFHLSLLDSLLESDAAIQAPPDLEQRRERFRTFEKIQAQPLPQGFTGELRPYQKHGFDWLHFLREFQFGGILADDMGLGKTIQMLAYLQSLREQNLLSGACLLVVPKSLVANWQREAERFTPGLRFLEYLGNLRNKDTAVFNDYDVVITTYGTMLRDAEILHDYTFDHIILDESQAIKNPLAKSAKAARLLKANHRLVMTGTPVENNTFELWSQFAFLNPGLLGNMEYFKKEFATPIESNQDETTATTLRKLVYPFILRRTKEQVAPELPPRTERVIYTDMDAAQKKLYAQTRERYRAELLGAIESEGMNDARFKILEGLLRLRQIAIHPALVNSSYHGDAAKFEVLFDTLETLQAEKHKALIFSQFVETLRLVRSTLDERKIRYVYMDGKTPHRQTRVDQFQNDPDIPFFLISLKAGGVGLNLTAADYVIHLDPWWNPAVEMQASDRAHRIGQDKPVFVYKIIARDTVEEKILQLQEKKRALVQNLIASETSFFKSLTKDDVKMLFS